MLTERQVELAELGFLLPTLPRVSVRVAAERTGASWTAKHIVVDAFPSHGRARPTWDHDYGDFRLAAVEISGEEIAAGLARSHLPFAGGIVVPAIHPTGTFRRLPSHSNWTTGDLAWPHMLIEHHAQQQNQVEQSSFVIGSGPFYPEFVTAAVGLLYGEQRQSAMTFMPNGFLRVRIADTRCRLKSVHIGPAAMTVEIDGSDRTGVSLVVSRPGAWEKRVSVARRRRVSIAMPGALDLMYFLLVRDHDWLDYRIIDSALIRGSSARQLESRGVTLAAESVSSAIENWIYQGEGPTIEFKQEVPKDPRGVLKTVVALANAGGGAILVGVADRSGEIIGVGPDTGPLKDRIVNIIRNRCEPEPVFDLEDVSVQSKTILVLRVHQGINKPYGIDPPAVQYFVRRGANTFPASPAEVRAMVASDLAHPASSLPGLGRGDSVSLF